MVQRHLVPPTRLIPPPQTCPQKCRGVLDASAPTARPWWAPMASKHLCTMSSCLRNVTLSYLGSILGPRIYSRGLDRPRTSLRKRLFYPRTTHLHLEDQRLRKMKTIQGSFFDSNCIILKSLNVRSLFVRRAGITCKASRILSSISLSFK